MVSKILAFAAVIFIQFCSALSQTKVSSCTEGLLLPDVTIEGCDEVPCKVNYNQILNFTMEFNSPRYLEKIKPSFNIKLPIFNWTYPIESHQKDACDGIFNTRCPLVSNEPIKYQYWIKLAQLPYIPFTVIFSIVDEDFGDQVICFNADMFPVISLDNV